MKCGFITIIGAPNAGKSTLLNTVIGRKISIVSPKVQTTRRRILGILTREDTQIIFVDTPGIFTPHASRPLETYMVKTAWQASCSGDGILFLIDCTRKNFDSDLAIIANLTQTSTLPISIVLNKIDAISKERLLEIAFPLNQYTHPVFMISALNGDGVNHLVAHLDTLIKEGDWIFPKEQLSDLPEKNWAAEVTREQLYLQLDHEIPYHTYVETEVYDTTTSPRGIHISQCIVVSRDSQKGIILGQAGARIRSIGTASRLYMKKYLKKPVHLQLFVKVTPDWQTKNWIDKIV